MTIEEVLNEMENENYEIDVKEQKEEIKVNMNIYQKLTYIQTDLLEIPIPKNGKNPFGNFKYYELEDLLPPILKLCKKYGCTLFFNFPISNGECEKGILNLINWENKDDCIRVQVPFPKIEKLPKMNYAQVSGTYQTYMKRYLILNTFDIVEKEIIDSGFIEEQNKRTTNTQRQTNSTAPQQNNTSQQQNKEAQQKNKITQQKTTNKEKSKVEKPECLDKVIEKCHKLYSDEECTGKLLNKVSLQMFNKKQLTLDERKEVFDYIKTLKKK